MAFNLTEPLLDPLIWSSDLFFFFFGTSIPIEVPKKYNVLLLRAV